MSYEKAVTLNVNDLTDENGTEINGDLIELIENYLSILGNISPSLEPSHAFAEAIKLAPKLKSSDVIIVNSCGDSLKDKDIIKQKLGSYIR